MGSQQQRNQDAPAKPRRRRRHAPHRNAQGNNPSSTQNTKQGNNQAAHPKPQNTRQSSTATAAHKQIGDNRPKPSLLAKTANPQAKSPASTQSANSNSSQNPAVAQPQPNNKDGQKPHGQNKNAKKPGGANPGKLATQQPAGSTTKFKDSAGVTPASLAQRSAKATPLGMRGAVPSGTKPNSALPASAQAPKPQQPKPQSPKPQDPKLRNPKLEAPKPQRPKPQSPKPQGPKPKKSKSQQLKSTHSKGSAARRNPNRGVKQPPRLETQDEISAGGLVFSGLAEAVDRHNKVDLSKIYVALIGRLDRRGRILWSIPKGHVEAGEDIAKTAEREVWEETGVYGEVFDTLGIIDYWFISDGVQIHKTVHHHLLRYVDGELNDEDPEVTEVAWIPANELTEHFAYADERKLARKIYRILPNIARAEKEAGRKTPRP